MIQMTLSTATQHPAFLPFWPLTVRQCRRRSPDDLAPTTGNRRGRAEPDPNAGGAPSTRQRVKFQRVRRSDLSRTDARTPQIPIGRVGETQPLPARDFVPWRFSDACRRSAWMAS